MPITMMFAADQLRARDRDYVNDYPILVDAQIAAAREFGFDYVAAISDPAREAMGAANVLLGNIEAAGVLRNGTPEDVRAAIATCREEAGEEALIVGAGCEVCRDTLPANLQALCECAFTHR